MYSVLATSKVAIELIAHAVEFAAALIIALACIEATVRAVAVFFKPSSPPQAKTDIRLTLGRWLAVALEFELAADVLSTAVTPSWSDIGKLAAVAALRTALNYFLEKEIAQEAQPGQKAAEAAVSPSSLTP